MHIYIYIIHIYFRGQPSRPGMNLHWCRGCLQMQVSCPIVVGYIERNSIYIYIYMCKYTHIYIYIWMCLKMMLTARTNSKPLSNVLFCFFFDGIFWHSIYIYIYIWTYGIIWYREDRTQQSASRHNMFFFCHLFFWNWHIHLYISICICGNLMVVIDVVVVVAWLK